ncbi:MAG: hypothetical protein AAFN74_16005 [Myxococcota bacterium]
MTFRIYIPIIACLAATFSISAACRTEPTVPPNVFAPWDGKWIGDFYVKDGNGRTLTTLRVEQEYRSKTPQRQFGYFKEVDMATQKMTTATATNSHDGTSMRCEVAKSNGEHVVHQGRWTGKAIEWSRDTPKAREFFSERVYTDKNGRTQYEITGWGEYDGGDRLHFQGRYTKQ